MPRTTGSVVGPAWNMPWQPQTAVWERLAGLTNLLTQQVSAPDPEPSHRQCLTVHAYWEPRVGLLPATTTGTAAHPSQPYPTSHATQPAPELIDPKPPLSVSIHFSSLAPLCSASSQEGHCPCPVQELLQDMGRATESSSWRRRTIR